MTQLTPITAVLILGCVLSESSRELCFKRAVDGVTVAQALRRPLLWLGILLWAVEIAVWVHVLQTVPLSIAFPLMALVYVTTQAAAVIFLKEHLTARHGIGALLITTGVAVIGSTGI